MCEFELFKLQKEIEKFVQIDFRFEFIGCVLFNIFFYKLKRVEYYIVNFVCVGILEFDFEKILEIFISWEIDSSRNNMFCILYL